MKAPSLRDRIVKVRAYLTDEVFGYEHWRAAQFSPPADARPAVLIVCASKPEQDALLELLTLVLEDDEAVGIDAARSQS